MDSELFAGLLATASWDGSLRYWQIAHEAYFRTLGGFDPAMMLWWEEFRLIEVIDTALAAVREAFERRRDAA